MRSSTLDPVVEPAGSDCSEVSHQRIARALLPAWATARKHLPDVDVAAAGGWKSTETPRRCYQQPDADTMLAVVLSGAELREKQAFLHTNLAHRAFRVACKRS